MWLRWALVTAEPGLMPSRTCRDLTKATGLVVWWTLCASPA